MGSHQVIPIVTQQNVDLRLQVRDIEDSDKS